MMNEEKIRSWLGIIIALAALLGFVWRGGELSEQLRSLNDTMVDVRQDLDENTRGLTKAWGLACTANGINIGACF